MKYSIILIFTLFFIYDCSSQEESKEKEKIKSNHSDHNYNDDRRFRKDTFAYLVKNLRQGSLIMKLRSNHEKIELLKERGYTKKAAEEQEKWDKFNKELMEAMSTYDYSDLKFTYGHWAKEKEEGLREYIYLDENLEIDSSLSVDSEYILYLQIRGYGYSAPRMYYSNHALVVSPHSNWSTSVNDIQNNPVHDGRSILTRYFYKRYIRNRAMGRKISSHFYDISYR